MVETQQETHILPLEKLLKQYKEDSLTQMALRTLQSKKDIQLKGLKGSLDAIIASTLADEIQQTFVFVLSDKEEAAYFLNDLENLLPNREVLFFPTSYKKPYEFTQIENANILQRSEVLNKINENEQKDSLIVTYPEALNEKVINQRSLLENTLSAKVDEALDVEFMTEVLQEYGFEKTDFVYEAGQYSVRGGIIDVYSFAQ